MAVNITLGGENALLKSDYVALGLIQNNNPASSIGGQAFSGPSLNGLPGRSIRLARPFSSAGARPLVSANGPDFGMFRLPKTTKQYWDAGGFAISGRLKFNSQVTTTIGIQQPNLTQTTLDPATNRLFSIRQVSGVSNLYTSVDLGITWSLITLPGGFGASLTNCNLSFANGYLCMTVHGSAAVIYSTNNLGSTWQTLTIANSYGNVGAYGVMYTGDSTYPYVVVCAGNGTSLTAPVLLSDLTPTAVQTPVVLNLNAANQYSPVCKIIQGYAYFSYANGLQVWGQISAGLQNTASWSVRTLANLGLAGAIYGIEFANNNWYFSGSSDSIKYLPNPGTLPAILPPASGTTAIAVTLRGESVTAPGGMYSMTRKGTELFAVGPSAYTAYSADNGATWTFETGTRVLTLQSGSYTWCCASSDRFFLSADSTTAAFATSFHAGYGWEVKSTSEGGETSNQTAVIFGVYGATAINPSNNVVTYQSAQTQIGLYASGVTGNARNVGVSYDANTGIPSFQYTVTDAQLNPIRHWELIYTADLTTTNAFFVTVRMDGNVVLGPTPASYPLAPTGDTTGFLMLNIPSNGTWTAFDDVVMNDFSGTLNNTPLGVSVIVPVITGSDDTVQWDRVGGAASNAATVAQTAPSGIPTAAYSPGQYVETSDVGDKDIYNAANTVDPGIVSGYNPRAIQVDGFFTRQGSATPQVKVGAVINGSEQQSSATTVSGLTRASVLLEVPGTTAALDVVQAKLTIQKTT